MSSPAIDLTVLTCSDIDADALKRLLDRFGIAAEWVAVGTAITGSFWGEPEAGIVGQQVFVRPGHPGTLAAARALSHHLHDAAAPGCT